MRLLLCLNRWETIYFKTSWILECDVLKMNYSCYEKHWPRPHLILTFKWIPRLLYMLVIEKRRGLLNIIRVNLGGKMGKIRIVHVHKFAFIYKTSNVNHIYIRVN